MNDGRQRFIEKHRAKFWYTPESSKREIGDDLLVETTLNYGTLDDFRELRDILTPRRMAQVFFSATGRKAGNYYPEIRHFYSLVLKPYLIPEPPAEDEIKSGLTELSISGV